MTTSDASGETKPETRPDASEKRRRPEWPGIAECTSVLGIRILLLVRRLLGERIFRLALLPVLAAHWLTNPRLRRVVFAWQRRANNLSGFLAPWGGKPAMRSGIAQLERFALAIMEKFAALSGRGEPAELEVIGDEMFRADPPGRGAVILTSHSGCQELLQSRSGAVTQHPLVILQHTAHARRFNELLAGARTEAAGPAPVFIEIGAEISPAVIMTLSEIVGRGGYVILAGDRTPMGSQASVRVPFLGAPARFPTGGALLAQLLGVPLRMMVCTRPSTERRLYRVHFAELCAEPPKLRRAARAAWLEAMTAAHAAELERRMLASPLDWANFYDFWEEFEK